MSNNDLALKARHALNDFMAGLPASCDYDIVLTASDALRRMCSEPGDLNTVQAASNFALDHGDQELARQLAVIVNAIELARPPAPVTNALTPRKTDGVHADTSVKEFPFIKQQHNAKSHFQMFAPQMRK